MVAIVPLVDQGLSSINEDLPLVNEEPSFLNEDLFAMIQELSFVDQNAPLSIKSFLL